MGSICGEGGDAAMGAFVVAGNGAGAGVGGTGSFWGGGEAALGAFVVEPSSVRTSWEVGGTES